MLIFNNIIFTIKDAKLYKPVVKLTANLKRNYQNFLAKNLKDRCIGMNTIKKKLRIKTQQTVDIFLMQLTNCFCWFI